MKVIYKYPIMRTNLQHIDIPRDSAIISFRNQGNQLVMYAMIDPNVGMMESRTIRIFGTGQDIYAEHPLYFKDTVMMPDGIVLHVFEEMLHG